MRHRRAIIRFPEKHGQTTATADYLKVLDGLNVRFSVKTFSQTGMPAQARIEIYNLNRDDLQFLTTSVASWLYKRSYIELLAGYDDNLSLLFSGHIIDAPPEGNPDVGLSINGMADVDGMSQNVNFQKSNTNFWNLVETCAGYMGYNVNCPQWLRDNNKWLNNKINEYSYTGTPMNLLKELQRAVGGSDYHNPDSLFFGTFNSEIYIWSPGYSSQYGRKFLINKNTGMVGYPHPTAVGVNVQIILNPDIRCGDVIHLESERVPIVNGDYYVTSIQHDGEVRGNQWYSTLQCATASTFTQAGAISNEQ